MREMQVFRLFGDGVEMNEVATQMRISVKTIETYRARIKQKLGIKNRIGLLKFAVEWTLIGRPFDPIQLRLAPSTLADGDGHSDGKVGISFSKVGPP